MLNKEEKMKKHKSLTALLVLMISFLNVSNLHSENIEIKFKDDEKFGNQKENIYLLAKHSIVIGFEDKTFKAEKTMTRAEFVTAFNRLMKIEYKGDFIRNYIDVSEKDWFYDNVMAASKNDYIHGFPDKSFRPNETISKEQVCKILDNTFKLADIKLDYKIADEVSPWAKTSVEKVLAANIMSIKDDKKFNSKSPAKRIEVAEALAYFLKGKIAAEKEKSIADTEKVKNQDKKTVSDMDKFLYIKRKLETDIKNDKNLNSKKQKEIIAILNKSINEYIESDLKDRSIIEKNKSKMKSLYLKLSKKERQELKTSISSNINIDYLKDLKKFFDLQN